MKSTSTSSQEEPRRRRLSFRFSLRTMLVVMTLWCAFCGVWMSRAVKQRQAVRRFYELTADRAAEHGDLLTTMAYRYQGRDEYYKPIIPKWLRPMKDLVGEEAFGEVTGVQLTGTTAGNEDLRRLASVSSVERVWLGHTQVTDEGLVHLRACPNLRFLILDATTITDRGLAGLGTLRKLETLSLSGTKVTDAGLVHLEKLPLKELWLRDTAISDAAYQRLQAALPNCTIQADVPSYYQKHQQQYWGTPGR